MNVKKYDIRMPKADYQIIGITIKQNGSIMKLDDSDLIFFTVRDIVNNEKIAIQKTLEDGILYNSDSGKYQIEIQENDTKNMDAEKRYGYDITIYFNGNKPKQQVVGKFILTQKYTLNEVIK